MERRRLCGRGREHGVKLSLSSGAGERGSAPGRVTPALLAARHWRGPLCGRHFWRCMRSRAAQARATLSPVSNFLPAVCSPCCNVHPPMFIMYLHCVSYHASALTNAFVHHCFPRLRIPCQYVTQIFATA